jgi:hypothetical protein
MARDARRSTACTEFAEQEVLDRIRQRRLDADRRREAAGGDELAAVTRRPATLRIAGTTGAAAMIARLRAWFDRSARPESPGH